MLDNRRNGGSRCTGLLPAWTVALILLAACSEGFTASIDTVSGPYMATTFTLTQANQTSDLLAAGASIELILLNQGTTGGRLFVPGGAEDGGDLDLSLEGTWTLQGARVTLQHEADTFLRDLVLTASDSHLEGEFTQSDEAVHVRLEKPGTND
jgi:hypothetical protein